MTVRSAACRVTVSALPAAPGCGSTTVHVSVRFDDLPSGARVIESDQKFENDDYVVNDTRLAANDPGLVSDLSSKMAAEGPGGPAVSESFGVTLTE